MTPNLVFIQTSPESILPSAEERPVDHLLRQIQLQVVVQVVGSVSSGSFNDLARPETRSDLVGWG